MGSKRPPPVRSYGSQPMTQKAGRLAFNMLIMNCTDAAFMRLTPDELAASHAGVSRDMANSALLKERLRRSL